MSTFLGSLSLLPLAILLILSLLRGVRTGIYAGLAVTIMLFFVWDSTLIAFPAALIAALIDTVSILMIVFGALFLHQSMEQIGFIDQIRGDLGSVHEDAGFQFYFLAFFLTAFFESVAGFGTPGAIVPLLLISMGFDPIRSIVVVLLIDGLFAISGAIGTPVTAGLEAPLGLSTNEVRLIYVYASGFMLIAGCAVVVFIQRLLMSVNIKSNRTSWVLFFGLAIPFTGLSFWLQELTGLVAATLLGILAYFFLFSNRKMAGTPWLPYAVLVVMLLLPKFFPGLALFLSWDLAFTYILNSAVSASLQPLESPLIPFLVAAFFAAVLGGNFSVSLKPVLRKTMAVFLILFPSLAITRLMLASGTEMPSMVETMSALFAKAGSAYPALSPLIGATGTFITGSTTVSNVIFGPVQFEAAQNLKLPHEVILAMQLFGASLGNAVCLFNIIAACAVAGVEQYAVILQKNLWPVIGATVVTSLCGMLLLWWIG